MIKELIMADGDETDIAHIAIDYGFNPTTVVNDRKMLKQRAKEQHDAAWEIFKRRKVDEEEKEERKLAAASVKSGPNPTAEPQQPEMRVPPQAALQAVFAQFMQSMM